LAGARLGGRGVRQPRRPAGALSPLRFKVLA